MPDNGFEEKRRFDRFPLEAKITFTLNDDEDTLYHGTSQNLSAGGIYITTNHLAKLGELIKLTLILDDQTSSPYIIEGKIVRSKFDKRNNELFHVSIEFAEPDEQSIKALSA